MILKGFVLHKLNWSWTLPVQLAMTVEHDVSLLNGSLDPSSFDPNDREYDEQAIGFQHIPIDVDYLAIILKSAHCVQSTTSNCEHSYHDAERQNGLNIRTESDDRSKRYLPRDGHDDGLDRKDVWIEILILP